ncbi:EAL domain-containing protein [Gallaecimonas sp. GXIMD4217]|uniref:EAL domain-containing protein n=1 Tax=Gallaecimonas sp. GXIMD4217 TaxID=3131927 RepID=UPI00311AC490
MSPKVSWCLRLAQLPALLLILSFAFFAQAETQYYEAQRVGLDEGLTQATVFDIEQDDEGYYWLATSNGLNRFDGYDIKTFFSDDATFPSKSNLIRKIFIDSKSNVWVGTQSDLLVRRKSEQIFKQFNNISGSPIWLIDEDKTNENLIIGFNDRIEVFKEFDDSKKQIISIPRGKSIAFSREKILIGTHEKGLFELSRDYKVTENTDRFGHRINSIRYYNGAFYIGSEQGLFFLSNDTAKKLDDSYTKDISASDAGIFFATEKGLYQYRHGKKFKLNSFNTWSLHINSESIVSGTHTDGFIKYNVVPLGLENIIDAIPGNYIRHISSDGRGNLFFTSDNGVYSRDVENTHFETLIQNKEAKKTFSIGKESISIFNTGVLLKKEKKPSHFYETRSGVNFAIFSKSTWWLIWQDGVISSFPTKEDPIQACSAGFVNSSLALDSTSILYAGDSGICKTNLTTKESNKLIADVWIRKLEVVNDKIIAISNHGSIYQVNDSEVRHLGQITLSKGEEILSIEIIQSENIFYLASATSLGIRVNTLRADESWTVDLVSFIPMKNGPLKEYTSLSSTTDGNGRIYFGGINGYSVINPTEFSKEKKSHEVKITKVKLFDNEHDDLLNSTHEKNLRLRYSDYPISFTLAAPGHPSPGNISFYYQLSDYGDRWYSLDKKSRTLTLSRLEPGEHELHFMAKDHNDFIVGRLDGLLLEVAPPWWKSTAAYSIYISIISLFALHILNIIRIRRQQHLKVIESEERLKLALWGSGDELWDWDIREGKIYRSNMWESLELPEDGLRHGATSDNSNIHRNDIDRVKHALNSCFVGDSDSFEVTYRVKGHDDQWIWILDRGKVVEYNDYGAPLRMTGTLKNISQLKKAEEKLKLFAKSFENISDAVCVLTADFVVVETNTAFTDITGYTRETVINKPWKFSLYSEPFTAQILNGLQKHGRWHDELEAERANGDIYPIEITIDTIRDEDEKTTHFVAVFSDISERKERERELERLTNTDTLTNLPNRSYFMTMLESLVRRQKAFSLLILDINNFKQINDSLGHQSGDQMLVEVAERLQYVLGESHTLYRLGGDEFAILVEQPPRLEDATRLSRSLHRQLYAPFYLKGQEVNVGCSIGAVFYPEDGETPETLLRNADAAMYHAKQVGGESCQFFSSSMNEQALARLALESRIRRAIRDGAFELHYQAKADTESSRICGVEALLRLSDGKGGYISPAEFIPVAEESGLIVDIGAWVLRAASEQVRHWYDAGIFRGRIAVNLSAKQFKQGDLVERIDEILDETGLPAHLLELEITEGTMMEDPTRAVSVMNRLRERGITLAMDDFGTGYSSLSHLRQFPVTTVKIDRSFIRELTPENASKSLTAAIMSLAENLDLSVVAEGVETEEQLQALKDLHCKQVQGFLFSRPVPALDFERLLTTREGFLGTAQIISITK